jgi:hypothetical protein
MAVTFGWPLIAHRAALRLGVFEGMPVVQSSGMPDVHCINNATAIPVVPISDDGTLQFGIYAADGSLCVPALHWRGTANPTQVGEMPPGIDVSTLPVLPPSIYGGLFFHHFGHFMTESIGRLWGVNTADLATLPIYVFEPWYNIDFTDQQHFAAEALRLLGVDSRRIIRIERPSLISKLLVPEQKYGWHFFMNPPQDFVSFLRKAQDRIEHDTKDAGPLPRKVYVSRALLPPSTGKVAGEQEFEQFLEGQGYHVLHPEQQPLSVQVQAYANAEQLIFCEGSAAHACILLPKLRAKVAIILRRKVSAIWLQFDGFGKEVTVIDAVIRQRSFGLPTYHGVSMLDYLKCSHMLRDAGFVCGSFDAWPSIAEAKERETLVAYARAIVDDHRFHSFLLATGAVESRAEVAEAKLATTEANLEAVLRSTSWRMTEPLRRLTRRLIRNDQGS